MNKEQSKTYAITQLDVNRIQIVAMIWAREKKRLPYNGRIEL